MMTTTCPRYTPSPSARMDEGFRIGPWQVEPARRRLLCVSTHAERSLEPRLMTLLCHLVNHAGQVLDRDELMALLWPRVIVNENSLTRAVSALRKQLHSSAASPPKYIETVSKRGYRLVPEVLGPSVSAPEVSVALANEGAAASVPAQAPDALRPLPAPAHPSPGDGEKGADAATSPFGASGLGDSDDSGPSGGGKGATVADSPFGASDANGAGSPSDVGEQKSKPSWAGPGSRWVVTGQAGREGHAGLEGSAGQRGQATRDGGAGQRGQVDLEGSAGQEGQAGREATSDSSSQARTRRRDRGSWPGLRTPRPGVPCASAPNAMVAMAMLGITLIALLSPRDENTPAGGFTSPAHDKVVMAAAPLVTGQPRYAGTTVTDGAAPRFESPALARDGMNYAFIERVGRVFNIYVGNLGHRSEPRLVYSSERRLYNLTWSPTRFALIFARELERVTPAALADGWAAAELLQLDLDTLRLRRLVEEEEARVTDDKEPGLA